MVIFFGRCHLPNVTAVERLKSVGDDTTDEHTGSDDSEISRVMVPSVRKSDADALHQIPLQERMTGR